MKNKNLKIFFRSLIILTPITMGSILLTACEAKDQGLIAPFVLTSYSDDTESNETNQIMQNWQPEGQNVPDAFFIVKAKTNEKVNFTISQNAHSNNILKNIIVFEPKHSEEKNECKVLVKNYSNSTATELDTAITVVISCSYANKNLGTKSISLTITPYQPQSLEYKVTDANKDKISLKNYERHQYEVVQPSIPESDLDFVFEPKKKFPSNPSKFNIKHTNITDLDEIVKIDPSDSPNIKLKVKSVDNTLEVPIEIFFNINWGAMEYTFSVLIVGFGHLHNQFEQTVTNIPDPVGGREYEIGYIKNFLPNSEGSAVSVKFCKDSAEISSNVIKYDPSTKKIYYKYDASAVPKPEDLEGVTIKLEVAKYLPAVQIFNFKKLTFNNYLPLTLEQKRTMLPTTTLTDTPPTPTQSSIDTEVAKIIDIPDNSTLDYEFIPNDDDYERGTNTSNQMPIKIKREPTSLIPSTAIKVSGEGYFDKTLTIAPVTIYGYNSLLPKSGASYLYNYKNKVPVGTILGDLTGVAVNFSDGNTVVHHTSPASTEKIENLFSLEGNNIMYNPSDKILPDDILQLDAKLTRKNKPIANDEVKIQYQIHIPSKNGIAFSQTVHMVKGEDQGETTTITYPANNTIAEFSKEEDLDGFAFANSNITYYTLTQYPNSTKVNELKLNSVPNIPNIPNTQSTFPSTAITVSAAGKSTQIYHTEPINIVRFNATNTSPVINERTIIGNFTNVPANTTIAVNDTNFEMVDTYLHYKGDSATPGPASIVVTITLGNETLTFDITNITYLEHQETKFSFKQKTFTKSENFSSTDIIAEIEGPAGTTLNIDNITPNNVDSAYDYDVDTTDDPQRITFKLKDNSINILNGTDLDAGYLPSETFTFAPTGYVPKTYVIQPIAKIKYKTVANPIFVAPLNSTSGSGNSKMITQHVINKTPMAYIMNSNVNIANSYMGVLSKPFFTRDSDGNINEELAFTNKNEWTIQKEDNMNGEVKTSNFYFNFPVTSKTFTDIKSRMDGLLATFAHNGIDADDGYVSETINFGNYDNKIATSNFVINDRHFATSTDADNIEIDFSDVTQAIFDDIGAHPDKIHITSNNVLEQEAVLSCSIDTTNKKILFRFEEDQNEKRVGQIYTVSYKNGGVEMKFDLRFKNVGKTANTIIG